MASMRLSLFMAYPTLSETINGNPQRGKGISGGIRSTASQTSSLVHAQHARVMVPNLSADTRFSHHHGHQRGRGRVEGGGNSASHHLGYGAARQC
jgi:hypothetical protein